MFSYKGKCIQAIWLPQNLFYGKSIPMFGLFKHFMENVFRFVEYQFPCLVRSNILRKMEFVLRKINSHVWFVDHFTENMKCLTTSAPALPKPTCNSTKIIIHFNIKNNHPNIPIIFISKQPHQSFTIGITPPWCTKIYTWYLNSTNT